MDRIDNILNNQTFKKCINRINEAEKNRKFCLHNIEHSIDVARIAYIISLQNNLSVEKDVIYATALLHDIGRAEEYDNGISHHEASSTIAKEILAGSGFDEAEIQMICDAIKKHKCGQAQVNSLGDLLYKADKLSRACYSCKVYEECYWDESKKNKTLQI